VIKVPLFSPLQLHLQPTKMVANQHGAAKLISNHFLAGCNGEKSGTFITI